MNRPDPPVLVFDGACNLCAAAVHFVLRNDRTRTVRFATLQSPAGKSLMRRHGLDPDEPGTLLLIKAGHGHTRSDAIIELAALLRFPWGLLRWVWWVPRRVRDRLYDLIARHRYRWFGKRDSGLIRTAAEQERFVPGGMSEAD